MANAKVQVNVRLDPDLYDEATAYAKLIDTPLSTVIALALETYLVARTKRKKVAA